MKKNDIVLLAVVAFITAVISLIASSVLFGGNQAKVQVKTAETISTGFPDVKHDPLLSSIFNNQSVDLAQPIPVGSSQNNQPFNGQ